MALLTKKEFSVRCGMTTKMLAAYASEKRRKVVYTGDRVNDQIEPNRTFMLMQSQKRLAKGKTSPDKVHLANQQKEQGQTEVDTSFLMLEKEKLRLQVAKLENENKKLTLGNEKTQGNFIPVEFVSMVVLQLSEAIHQAWENELDDFILKFAAKNGLTRQEIIMLRAEKIASSNSSREKAIVQAKKMIRTAQRETSDKRGVGEHD